MTDEKKPSQQDAMVTVAGHRMPKATIFKFMGLLAFFVLMGVVVVLLWPYLSTIFAEGGVDAMVERIRADGPFGVGVLLLLQFIQIVVAFIPGEITQLAAGMLYGPLWGTLIILLGCFLSSAFIYALVHRLGAPFVEAMVPAKYMEKVDDFAQSGKLNVVVFILFFIPGLPKDVFTYLVPLTEMRVRPYLIITTVARIPGVVLSTLAASGLMNGNITMSIVVFVVLAIIAAIVFLLKDKLFALLHKHS